MISTKRVMAMNRLLMTTISFLLSTFVNTTLAQTILVDDAEIWDYSKSINGGGKGTRVNIFVKDSLIVDVLKEQSKVLLFKDDKSKNLLKNVGNVSIIYTPSNYLILGKGAHVRIQLPELPSTNADSLLIKANIVFRSLDLTNSYSHIIQIKGLDTTLISNQFAEKFPKLNLIYKTSTFASRKSLTIKSPKETKYQIHLEEVDSIQKKIKNTKLYLSHWNNYNTHLVKLPKEELDRPHYLKVTVIPIIIKNNFIDRKTGIGLNN